MTNQNLTPDYYPLFSLPDKKIAAIMFNKNSGNVSFIAANDSLYPDDINLDYPNDVELNYPDDINLDYPNDVELDTNVINLFNKVSKK